MKKILLLLLLVAASNAFAQVKIGLRLAPSYTLNRLVDKDGDDGFSFSNDGGMTFVFGPHFDFMFGDNYAFSTGLWYASKYQGYKSSLLAAVPYEEVVRLQTIQAPLTFKVFTNEIATGQKLYFQLGGVLNFSFNEKFKESDPDKDASDYIKKYSFFDLGLHLGAGWQMEISETNSVYAGLYYQRGLINLARNVEEDNIEYNYKDAVKINTDLIGLEVGFMF
jgi:hypothetical protein